MTISDELKKAVRASGKTLAEISAALKLPQGTLSRFLSDDPKTHRDIRLEATADRLAEYLGIKIQKPAKPTKKPAKGK